MVAAALIVLVDLGRVSPLIALIIIGREITISALREWMAKAGKSASVAVSFVGKLKTAAQMIAIVLLLYVDPARRPAHCRHWHAADLGRRPAHPGFDGVLPDDGRPRAAK